MKIIHLLPGIVWALSAAPACIAQLPSYVPANGLMAWYPFNGNANDASGNNNNGTNYGAVPVPDRFGNAGGAYAFNGTNSYISVPTSASLESPVTSVTFSAWINLAGLSLVGQPFGPILTKSDGGANAFMYRFTVDLNATGFYAGTNNWTSNIGAAYLFQMNQWYMLSAVLDSDSAYLYVNDTLLSVLPNTTNILNNTLPLEIGSDRPGTTEIFNGLLDDIGIWNRALSPQEITGLYNGPSSGIDNPDKGSHYVVYPNPFRGDVHVLAESNSENSSFTLFDCMGKTMYEGLLGCEATILPTRNLNPGLYILRINDRTHQSFKLIRN